MADYDNSNSVVLFPANSLNNEDIIGTGNVQFDNDDASKKRAIFTETTLKNGKIVRRVYLEVGAVFDVQSDNEKAPAFSGPLNIPHSEANQISLWLRNGAKGEFLSGRISVREQNGGGSKSAAPSSFGRRPAQQPDLDDDIPF